MSELTSEDQTEVVCNECETVFPAYVFNSTGNCEVKGLVKPLAEGLMQRGINVWDDNWEIGYGDSLRRRMEEGLGDCTHFVVLLTETSIRKPWVNEEIDAGLMGAVEGNAKFIGLRHELPLASVSAFLKTRLTPEFKPGEEGLEALAGEIYGISKKPPLGKKPRYVQSHEAGSTWSASAQNVAEYFVRNSEHAQSMDPQASYAEIQQETGLPMSDVRIGVLDLIGAGLLEKQEYFGGEAHIWPKADLFVTFDADFMEWDPEKDARDLAVHLTNLDADQADASEVGRALGWEPQRFNAAAAYLVSARVVEARHLGTLCRWKGLSGMVLPFPCPRSQAQIVRCRQEGRPDPRFRAGACLGGECACSENLRLLRRPE